jgi:hypothetical protein
LEHPPLIPSRWHNNLQGTPEAWDTPGFNIVKWKKQIRHCFNIHKIPFFIKG